MSHFKPTRISDMAYFGVAQSQPHISPRPVFKYRAVTHVKTEIVVVNETSTTTLLYHISLLKNNDKVTTIIKTNDQMNDLTLFINRSSLKDVITIPKKQMEFPLQDMHIKQFLSEILEEASSVKYINLWFTKTVSHTSRYTSFLKPQMEGYLLKEGHIYQKWNERFVLINNKFLIYYVNKSCFTKLQEPNAVIDLRTCRCELFPQLQHFVVTRKDGFLFKFKGNNVNITNEWFIVVQGSTITQIKPKPRRKRQMSVFQDETKQAEPQVKVQFDQVETQLREITQSVKEIQVMYEDVENKTENEKQILSLCTNLLNLDIFALENAKLLQDYHSKLRELTMNDPNATILYLFLRKFESFITSATILQLQEEGKKKAVHVPTQKYGRKTPIRRGDISPMPQRKSTDTLFRSVTEHARGESKNIKSLCCRLCEREYGQDVFVEHTFFCKFCKDLCVMMFTWKDRLHALCDELLKQKKLRKDEIVLYKTVQVARFIADLNVISEQSIEDMSFAIDEIKAMIEQSDDVCYITFGLSISECAEERRALFQKELARYLESAELEEKKKEAMARTEKRKSSALSKSTLDTLRGQSDTHEKLLRDRSLQMLKRTSVDESEKSDRKTLSQSDKVRKSEKGEIEKASKERKKKVTKEKSNDAIIVHSRSNDRIERRKEMSPGELQKVKKGKSECDLMEPCIEDGRQAQTIKKVLSSSTLKVTGLIHENETAKEENDKEKMENENVTVVKNRKEDLVGLKQLKLSMPHDNFEKIVKTELVETKEMSEKTERKEKNKEEKESKTTGETKAEIEHLKNEKKEKRDKKKENLKGEKTDKIDKTEKIDKIEKIEKNEKIDQIEKKEKKHLSEQKEEMRRKNSGETLRLSEDKLESSKDSSRQSEHRKSEQKTHHREHSKSSKKKTDTHRSEISEKSDLSDNSGKMEKKNKSEKHDKHDKHDKEKTDKHDKEKTDKHGKVEKEKHDKPKDKPEKQDKDKQDNAVKKDKHSDKKDTHPKHHESKEDKKERTKMVNVVKHEKQHTRSDDKSKLKLPITKQTSQSPEKEKAQRSPNKTKKHSETPERKADSSLFLHSASMEALQVPQQPKITPTLSKSDRSSLSKLKRTESSHNQNHSTSSSPRESRVHHRTNNSDNHAYMLKTDLYHSPRFKRLPSTEDRPKSETFKQPDMPRKKPESPKLSSPVDIYRRSSFSHSNPRKPTPHSFNSNEFIKRKRRNRYDFDDESSVDKSATRSPSPGPVNLMNYIEPPSRFKTIGLDDFDVVKKFSQGAYSKLYLVRKRKTNDIYAMKVSKKASIITKNVVDGIMVEKHILQQSHNRSIVKLYYTFQTEYELFFVMEFCPGGDLGKLLAKVGCLEEDVAKIYSAEIVVALEYIHNLGFIHRDLKPDNILINKNGHLLITDFGLSLAGDIVKDVNYEKKLFCTPDYCAPESLMERKYYTCSDYFSLGCIIFEMLTGSPPFNEATPEMIFDRIRKGKYEWPEDDGVSSEGLALVNGLLQHDYHLRIGYSGIDEIKNDEWFVGINWNSLLDESREDIFVPELAGDDDTGYFEDMEDMRKESMFRKDNEGSEEEFNGFDSVGMDQLVDQNLRMAELASEKNSMED